MQTVGVITAYCYLVILPSIVADSLSMQKVSYTILPGCCLLSPPVGSNTSCRLCSYIWVKIKLPKVTQPDVR